MSSIYLALQFWDRVIKNFLIQYYTPTDLDQSELISTFWEAYSQAAYKALKLVI